MAVIAKRARANLAWWEHLHGGRRDFWRLLGELFDGSWGWRRTMPMAHNTSVPAASHADLVCVETWDREDLWRFLR